MLLHLALLVHGGGIVSLFFPNTDESKSERYCDQDESNREVEALKWGDIHVVASVCCPTDR